MKEVACLKLYIFGAHWKVRSNNVSSIVIDIKNVYIP